MRCDKIMFTEWNRAFDKLRHKHDTWYIFRDWLGMTIDQFTIPGMTPLFTHKDRYTEQEYTWFGELLTAYIQGMDKALETRPYYDFLGEWWESDQNMTNKFKAQFFTPMNVCELMVSMCVCSDAKNNDVDRIQVMTDSCCGSGRFGIVYHDKRPYDWFFLADLDEYAVKMTIVNMLLHGMRGVVAWQNTLTKEVFGVWVISPDLLSYGGLPYVVPYGTDLEGAKRVIPRGEMITAPETDNVSYEDKTNVSYKHKTNRLDDWLQ